MTQKELLYVEDAFGHEETIISVINDMIDSLDDDNLVSYMEAQLEKHESIKEQLITLLEECNNG